MSQFGDITIQGRATQTLPANADDQLIRQGEAKAIFNSLFKGNWNNITTYEIGESVNDDGGFYVANLQNLNKKPSANPTEWRAAAGKGASSYTYIRYASDASGTGFSTSPAGKSYVAFLTTATPLGTAPETATAPESGEVLIVPGQPGLPVVTVDITSLGLAAPPAAISAHLIAPDSGADAFECVLIGGWTATAFSVRLLGLPETTGYKIAYILLPGTGGSGTGPVVGDFAGLWVKFVGDVTTADTDTVTEGSTNLYYTDARVRACVLTGLATGSGGAIAATDTVLQAFGKAQNRLAALEARTTDAWTEGVGNLYFTNARARAALSATAPLTYDSGTGVFTCNADSAATANYLVQRDANGDFAARKLALGTAALTDHLTFGTSATLGYYAGAATFNVPLKSDTYVFGATHELRATPGGLVCYSASADGNAFEVQDDALYIPVRLTIQTLGGVLKASAGQVAGSATTTDLTEGSNLYFTNARADARADVRIAAVAGVASGLATLDSGGKLTSTQLPASVVGATIYQGTWNANTNSPALASSTGTKGNYYVVATAGATNLDGVTDWKIGDWAIFNGTIWQKVDNTDAVSSVNGATGTVVLTTTNIAEGTNLYYTDARVRACVLTGFSATTGAISATDTVLTAFNKTQGRLAAIEAWTTTNLTEGTNLYYTDARVKTIAAAGLNAVIVSPAASSSGSPALFTVSGPAHTTLAASVEATDVYLNLNRIVQFATGALTTQRAVRVSNPRYAFVAASTLTEASTVEIDGAPVAHTNATITTAIGLKITGAALNASTGAGYSLYVEAPTAAVANYAAYFGGTIVLPGGLLIGSGAGTPEGALAAPVGSLFLRNNGGAATSIYVKETGTGNTGWVGK